MRHTLNTFVDFHADFLKPTSMDDPVGRDLAELVAAELRQHGIEVHCVEDDQFAYLILCKSGEQACELYAGVDCLGEVDRWTLIIRPRYQFRWPWQRPPFDPEQFKRLLLAVDDVLKQSDRIGDIRWFESFDVPDVLERRVAYGGPVPDEVVHQPVLSGLERLDHGCRIACDYITRHTIVVVIISILVTVIGAAIRNDLLLGLGVTLFLISICLSLFLGLSTVVLSTLISVRQQSTSGRK